MTDKSLCRTELTQEWFAAGAVEVARNLLGKTIKHGDCEGIIVETEAYTTDQASHGRVLTPRSALMHETYGRWYVYFTYGMHFCVNVTTDKGSVGAVLIRAVEPTKGLELMYVRRKTENIKKLCNGPAKLCQAFGISLHENGLPISGDMAIYDAPEIPIAAVKISRRIGITRDKDLPWRFSVHDNQYVSRIAL